MATVLVVDDNVELLGLFATCFRLCGFTVVEVGTIREAVGICQHMKVDAMVVDLALPDGLGSDLLTKMGKCLPSIKILLTGYGNSKRLQEEHSGFDEYLAKPIDCKYLCDMVCRRIKEL